MDSLEAECSCPWGNRRREPGLTLGTESRVAQGTRHDRYHKTQHSGRTRALPVRPTKMHVQAAFDPPGSGGLIARRRAHPAGTIKGEIRYSRTSAASAGTHNNKQKHNRREVLQPTKGSGPAPQRTNKGQ